MNKMLLRAACMLLVLSLHVDGMRKDVVRVKKTTLTVGRMNNKRVLKVGEFPINIIHIPVKPAVLNEPPRIIQPKDQPVRKEFSSEHIGTILAQYVRTYACMVTHVLVLTTISRYFHA